MIFGPNLGLENVCREAETTSVVDPDSIGSLEPYPDLDPGGQK
jgi:hypothetical protein